MIAVPPVREIGADVRHALVDVTLSAMVSTADRSILWVSNSFAEHFEVSSTEVVGVSVSALLEGSPPEMW
ncbi:MAG: hypothetical protein ACXVJ3_17445, partial [Ilumatobacteraceae bacterium]